MVPDTVTEENGVNVGSTPAPRLGGPFSDVFLLTLTCARSSKSQMKKEGVAFFFRKLRIKVKKLVLASLRVDEHSGSVIYKSSLTWHMLSNVHVFTVGTIIISMAKHYLGNTWQRVKEALLG